MKFGGILILLLFEISVDSVQSFGISYKVLKFNCASLDKGLLEIKSCDHDILEYNVSFVLKRPVKDIKVCPA